MELQRESMTERVSNRGDENRKYNIEGEISSTDGMMEQLNNGQVYERDGTHRAHFNVGASPLNINFSGDEITDEQQLEIFAEIQKFVAAVKERAAGNA